MLLAKHSLRQTAGEIFFYEGLLLRRIFCAAWWGHGYFSMLVKDLRFVVGIMCGGYNIRKLFGNVKMGLTARILSTGL